MSTREPRPISKRLVLLVLASDAQLKALKVGLLACGFVVLASLLATRNLPRRRLAAAA